MNISGKRMLVLGGVRLMGVYRDAQGVDAARNVKIQDLIPTFLLVFNLGKLRKPRLFKKRDVKQQSVKA